MLKKLMQTWNDEEFSSKVVKEFLEMIRQSQAMLEIAFRSFTENTTGDQVPEEIYLVDQKINLTERNIRKRVLIHLSTHPDTNLSASLALISLAKDAERLGDYVKNISELKPLLKNSENGSELFTVLFGKIGNKTLALFDRVYTAFESCDMDKAIIAMNKGNTIAKECEKLLKDIIKSDYTVEQSVVLSLGAGYIKRIARHLANIASSVINPVYEIDFWEK